MKQEIQTFITQFAETHDQSGLLPLIWRTPLIRFGNAADPGMQLLPNLVHPEHLLPEDVLPDARTIIVYFFPFTKEISNSNRPGPISSREWALSYRKTNAVFQALNDALITWLGERGVRAAVTPEAFHYDEARIKSRWSHRHIAVLSGMGTFGINNMLITAEGCCGRLGTIVTDLDVEPDHPVSEEYCLKKCSNTCGVCIKRCPAGALTPDGYDRVICSDYCDKNSKVHSGYADSFPPEYAELLATGIGTCGKCTVGLPCTFRRP